MTLKSDILHIITGNATGHDGMRLAVTGAAKQITMTPRLTKQFARLLGISGTVAGGDSSAGWFLQPGNATVADTLTYLRHTAVTILTDKTMLGAHYISKTLGIGAGMAFVTIVGNPAMMLMYGL